MTPCGRPRGQSRFQHFELGGDERFEIALDLVGALAAALVELPPAGDRQRVVAAHGKIRAGEMQMRQRFAERRAVGRARPADPQAVEESDDRRRTFGDLAQKLAGAVLHRLRAGQAAARQMLHQREEERQIAFRHAPLVQRQDEIAAVGVDQEIRVLDAFGDALIGKQLADIVTGKKAAQIPPP